MENKFLSPPSTADNMRRRLSPLRSPGSRRLFAPFEDNIHYPYLGNSLDPKPEYKNVAIGKDGYSASVDVHDFKPEEISMKIVGHTIIVTLKHDEKDEGDGSLIERHLVKKFIMPPKMDVEKIKSWTSDGVLYLKVPYIQTTPVERIVPVQQQSS